MPFFLEKNNFNNYYGGKGLSRGIVKEVKVVDNLNTLSVQLIEDGLELPCVQVASSVAHKKSGIVAIPSVGDEVLVDFIDNDMGRPVVVGSIYNAQNKPPITVSKNDNTDICIVLPSGKASEGNKGLRIDISCESKKGKVKVTTENKHIIELDDDKGIVEIKEKSGKTSFTIDFENGKITLKAEKTIAMKAGNSKFELDSEKGASIASNSGDIKMNGKSFECNANTNAKINAKAGQLELNGATVKVNANTILELKGSMTKMG